jgi:hypothetical protein
MTVKYLVILLSALLGFFPPNNELQTGRHCPFSPWIQHTHYASRPKQDPFMLGNCSAAEPNCY